MNKTIEQYSNSLIGIHSGTINAGVIDGIKIPYHGQPTPLKHLAHSSRISSGIEIKIFDPQLVGQVANALKAAGFNAYVFSKQVVMVPVEPPSGEQKRQVVDHIYKLGEESKIAIRNIRKKAKQDSKDLTEDEQKRFEKELQKLTDQAIAMIDTTASNKVKKL